MIRSLQARSSLASQAHPVDSVNSRVQFYFGKPQHHNPFQTSLPLSKLRMHSLSSIAIFALASLHLAPAVLAIPWTSSDPAPAPNGATAPRGLQLLNRGYDADDAHDFYLKDDDDHQVWASIERTFGIINEIPDEVLEKGDDETDKWLVNHGHRTGPPQQPPFTRRNLIPKAAAAEVLASKT